MRWIKSPVWDLVWVLNALWLAPLVLLPAPGFATGFIHYLLDRAAFRFSSPDVRQAARGLLEANP